MRKILVSGGNGRFATELKKIKSNYKFFFCNKKQLNILSIKSIEKNFKKYKPDYILHLAGLSKLFFCLTIKRHLNFVLINIILSVYFKFL